MLTLSYMEGFGCEWICQGSMTTATTLQFNGCFPILSIGKGINTTTLVKVQQKKSTFTTRIYKNNIKPYS